AGANPGPAPELTDTALRWLDLLFVAASGNAALCLESRRIPLLGVGSFLRCRSGHRVACPATGPWALFALKGVVDRRGRDNCRRNTTSSRASTPSIQFVSCKPVGSVARSARSAWGRLGTR